MTAVHQSSQYQYFLQLYLLTLPDPQPLHLASPSFASNNSHSFHKPSMKLCVALALLGTWAHAMPLAAKDTPEQGPHQGGLISGQLERLGAVGPGMTTSQSNSVGNFLNPGLSDSEADRQDQSIRSNSVTLPILSKRQIAIIGNTIPVADEVVHNNNSE